MSDDGMPHLTTVPRDLYYHEVAYVRGLEAEIKRLRKWGLEEAQKALEAENKVERLLAALKEYAYGEQGLVARRAIAKAEPRGCDAAGWPDVIGDRDK